MISSRCILTLMGKTRDLPCAEHHHSNKHGLTTFVDCSMHHEPTNRIPWIASCCWCLGCWNVLQQIACTRSVLTSKWEWLAVCLLYKQPYNMPTHHMGLTETLPTRKGGWCVSSYAFCCTNINFLCKLKQNTRIAVTKSFCCILSQISWRDLRFEQS